MDQNGTASAQDLLAQLPFLNMGSGFIIGMAVGYFLKKSFKIMLFLLGIAVVIMFGLEHYHIISIDETHLQETVSTGTDTFKRFALFLKDRLAQFGVAGTGSALAGFAVGLKIG